MNVLIMDTLCSGMYSYSGNQGKKARGEPRGFLTIKRMLQGSERCGSRTLKNMRNVFNTQYMVCQEKNDTISNFPPKEV